MLDISLGRALRFQLVRRHDANPAVITRGLLAVGDVSASLPERNLSVAVNLPRVNLDFWRGLVAGQGNGSERDESSFPTLPAVQFDLRATDLILMEKGFHEVRINGSRPEGSTSTRFELRSRELAGNFEWSSAGSGKLSGRIAQFSIPEAAATPAVMQARASEVIERIPALDITVDQLSFKDRTLGTVRIAAENREGYWNAKVDAKNDDGTLEASGRWRPSPTQPDTRVEFKLASATRMPCDAAAPASPATCRGTVRPLRWITRHSMAASSSMPPVASSSSSSRASAACSAYSACNPCRAESRSTSATSSATASPSTASAASSPSRAA
jgi:uncharacterized protein YhdP